MGPSNKRRKIILDNKPFTFVVTTVPKLTVFLTDAQGQTRTIDNIPNMPDLVVSYGSKNPRWSLKWIKAIYEQSCIQS